MNREQRTALIKKLKSNGAKRVPQIRDLYITDNGKVYTLKKTRYLKPSRGFVRYEDNILNVAKLVLCTFGGEPYRNGHVNYKDGNKENLSIKNLEYSALFSPSVRITPPAPEKIIEALRCYVEVPEGFSTKDVMMTKFYLLGVVEKRGFFGSQKDDRHIEVFRTYLIGKNQNGLYSSCSGLKIAETAKHHKISYRDCANIINWFVSKLVFEILRDKEKGLLFEKPYLKKPKSKRELVNSYKKFVEQLKNSINDGEARV